MATPIQYVPQYVPTDIGTISNILGQRQQEYEAGYAAPLLFEDQYAQIPVTAENIAGKQALLENFKGRVQNIVDRYGGDYGAAAKDIAREISKERQNPFYQLAPQHFQAVQRQQQLMDKYGAFALPLSEVGKQFVTPEGQVLQDVNLAPVVLNQQDLERALATEFGDRARQIRQTGLYPSGKPGLYAQATTRGVTEEEIPGLVEEMKNRLYEMNPDLAAAIDAGDPRAQQIAENIARQMIGGRTIDYTRDPAFGKTSEAKSPFDLNIPLVNITTLGVKDQPVEELKTLKNFKKIDEKSNPVAQAFKKDVDKVLVRNENFQDLGITDNMDWSPNVTKEVINRNLDGSINTEKTLENIDNYLNSISKKEFAESVFSMRGSYWGKLKDKEGNIIEEGDKTYLLSDIEKMSPEERISKNIPEDYMEESFGVGRKKKYTVHAPRKIRAIEEQQEAYKNYQKLERFKDFYDLSVEKALEGETSDWAVDFYDFDLAGADPGMRRNITNLTDQFYRMNADDFVFLTAPKDADVLVEGSEKKQDKYKREHNLRSNGAFEPVGIGSLTGEGVIFRVTDRNGEEYTIKPRNPQATVQLIRMFGNEGFLRSEIDYQIKSQINANLPALQNNYSNFREFILDNAQTREESQLFIEALKSRGITLDEEIRPLR